MKFWQSANKRRNGNQIKTNTRKIETHLLESTGKTLTETTGVAATFPAIVFVAVAATLSPILLFRKTLPQQFHLKPFQQFIDDDVALLVFSNPHEFLSMIFFMLW